MNDERNKEILNVMKVTKNKDKNKRKTEKKRLRSHGSCSVLFVEDCNQFEYYRIMNKLTHSGCIALTTLKNVSSNHKECFKLILISMKQNLDKEIV